MSHDRNTHIAHPPRTEAAAAAPEHSGKAITLTKVHPFGPQPGVVLTSDDVSVDGRLDPACTQEEAHEDGANRSPALRWDPVAEATSWCLIVEDPDAPREDPVLHWAIWNLPGPLTALPGGVAVGERLVTPQDAVQGANTQGVHGWMGPKPPPGHGAHRYHFQLFALAKPLELGPDADLQTLTGALKADTLASGLMVATFEVPAP